MKINIQSLHGIEPKVERINSSLIIDVYFSNEQMQDLFYQIWTEIGDDTLQKWLNSEEKKMIDLPKCEHEYTTECIDNGHIVYLLCTKCGEQLTAGNIDDSITSEDVESEAKMILNAMHIKKGYGNEWTDEDLLTGLKLMCGNYRNYLLKKE